MKFTSWVFMVSLMNLGCGHASPRAANSDRCITRVSPASAAANASLVFLSDTQEPLWIEKLWLKDEKNAEVMRQLFESVAAERPDAIFHGGDLVAMGSSRQAWRRFGEAMLPVSRLKIPVFATPGNHEFLFRAERGRRLFTERFPRYAACPWQTVEVGPLAVILLDSNFPQLPRERVAAQDRGFAAELARLDGKAEIHSILVLTHYSPYTNGTVVSPSREVQDHFVPEYLASPKARLMLSGHSHVFEHLRQGGKDFMVIGGGGGLLHPRLTGAQARFPVVYPGEAQARGFFHYLKVEAEDGGFAVTVMRYDPGRKAFVPDYRYRASSS